MDHRDYQWVSDHELADLLRSLARAIKGPDYFTVMEAVRRLEQ